MTLQTYLLASLSNTDAWNNHFLTLLSDRGIHIINANSRREEPHPPSLSRSFWADSNCPRSFSNLMPVFSSLHSRLWPSRQVCIPNQEPSATSQPGMRTRVCRWRCGPSPPPSFTCRGAAALILAPGLLPRRLAQTSSPSGLAQQAAACPSSASAAAELCQKGLPWRTEQWSGRVYRLEEKKKKPNPNTSTDRPGELSAGTADEGHSNVMCIFLGQLFLSLTWTPFPPIIRLLNSQSRAPNLLAVRHIHLQTQITGLFAVHVGIQCSQRIHI